MKSYLIYYVFITLSIFLNSCTEGFKEEYSKLVIALTEVTAITTPTTDTTPDYTFSSTGSGALTYGGSCSSSTSIATIGNNTITLNTLSVDTYADCTITVSKTIFTENSEKKLSGSLTITSFTVSSSDDSSSYSSGWQLIARQVDSDNFTDGTNELFSSNARTTFLQNENDNSSSTFMSIGHLTRSNYVTDGKYKFKLVWDGMQVASENIKEVIWTQTSWLTDSTIQGFQEIGDSGFNDMDDGKNFEGLGKSSSNKCVIDGDASRHGNWWNCVGAINTHTYGDSTGMPGPLRKIASSMHLYIWTPEIKETNYALDFDGVDDYVATASNISALNITADITISSWVKISSMPDDWARIIGKGTSSQRTYGLWIRNDSKLLFQIYGANGYLNLFANTTLSTGAWYHILATRSGNTVTIYVNGVADGTTTYSGTANSSSEPLTFGYGFHSHYSGQLDEVAIWDVALDAADVTSLYNSGNGLKASANSGNYDNSADLVGYWKFNEGTGSTLTDNTSNSNNGTLTNMVSSDWVTSGSETKPSFQ